MPPRRTTSIASCSAASRSTPACSISFSVSLSGQQAGEVWASLAPPEPWASMPTASITAVGAAAVVQLADRRRRAAGRRRSRAGRATSAPWRRGPLQPLGHEVDADDPSTRRGGRRSDTPSSRSDRDRARRPSRRRDVGVLHRLPRGGQHIGEVDEAVVGRALGHLDRAVLGLRHPQQLGLAAGHLAVQLGVAEQRCAPVVLVDLGGLALGLQARRRTSSSGRRRC